MLWRIFLFSSPCNGQWSGAKEIWRKKFRPFLTDSRDLKQFNENFLPNWLLYSIPYRFCLQQSWVWLYFYLKFNRKIGVFDRKMDFEVLSLKNCSTAPWASMKGLRHYENTVFRLNRLCSFDWAMSRDLALEVAYSRADSRVKFFDPK